MKVRTIDTSDSRLLQPEAALSVVGSSQVALSPEQIASWREAGYALVDGLFPAELIESLRADAASAYPPPGSREAESITDFGSEGGFVFPSGSVAFNSVTLYPALLGAVAELLGTSIAELRLTQSDLWPKYGPNADASDGGKYKARDAYDNQDQRIHVDYPNHMLAHPTPWQRPEAVEAILYLSDFEDCGGPTAIVPRMGEDDPCYPWPIVDTPGVGDLHYVNDRQSAEKYMAVERPETAEFRAALYARERYVCYQPGTLLLYRHDAWHRGTPLRPGTCRLAQNLSFRKAECEWISTLHVGWAWQLYRRDQAFAKLLASASLDQRAVLGFPQPGASYWCEQTVEAVKARYGVFGMDMTPYSDAL